jgi:hypothetical protein
LFCADFARGLGFRVLGFRIRVADREGDDRSILSIGILDAFRFSQTL